MPEVMPQARASLSPSSSTARVDGWTWLIIGLALLALLVGIGLRSPWPADEPRFAQVAREMVESGQWLFPTRGGEFYPDKPPVFMWLVALSYLLTGHLKVAFLLPSALAALGSALLVYDLGRRLWNARIASLAVLTLVFTPQFLLQGKVAQIDALVCFWITLGCYGLVRHFVTGPAWRWYFVAWAAMGLGIMTKGVGFLPMLMLIPLAVWRQALIQDRAVPAARVWSARNWLGLLVLLLTVACWLVPMLWAVQQGGTPEMEAYRNNILFRQTAQRYANSWGHLQPWHYFLTQAIPTVWLPVAAVLLTQWRALVRLWRADARVRVLLSWVVLVIVFFSISRGKREVYILPALPMLSLVVAALWAQVLDAGAGRGTRVLLRLVVVAMALGVMAVGITLHVRPDALVAKAGDYGDALLALATPLLVLGVAVLAGLVAAWRLGLFQQLALTSVLVWIFVAGWVWPKLDSHRTPNEVMAALEQQVPKDVEVGLLDFKEQFLLFTRRPLTHFSYLDPLAEEERNAWQWMQENPQKRVIFVPSDVTLACFDIHALHVLGNAHRRDWGWLDAASMRPECATPQVTRRFRYEPRRFDILE